MSFSGSISSPDHPGAFSSERDVDLSSETPLSKAVDRGATGALFPPQGSKSLAEPDRACRG
jgi:hypothetical protein